MEAKARLRRLRRQTILSLAVAGAAVLTGPASALGAGAGASVSNGVFALAGSGTDANRLALSQGQDVAGRTSLSKAPSGQRADRAKTSRRGRTIIKKKRKRKRARR